MIIAPSSTAVPIADADPGDIYIEVLQHVGVGARGSDSDGNNNNNNDGDENDANKLDTTVLIETTTETIYVCMPHCVYGTCTSNNTCHCDPGWDGPQCSNPVCIGDLLSYGSKQLCMSKEDNKRNWTESNNACVDFGGGRLATYVDPAFMELIRTIRNGSYWIGGMEGEDYGDWFWLDGEQFWEEGDVAYAAPWYEGTPSHWQNEIDDCLYMHISEHTSLYGFYPNECSREKSYVCEAGPFEEK